MTGVPVRALCIRRKHRHPVVEKEASVEVMDAASFGLCRSVTLRDISVVGLSIVAEAAAPQVHRFMLLPNVLVRIQGREIQGDLLVAHVTPESGSVFVCGGRFHPSTEADRRDLEQLVANLERRPGAR